MAEPLTNFEKGQIINENAMAWVAMFTGRSVPTVRTTQQSYAEQLTGSKLDGPSLIILSAFVIGGLWLATRK